jgi:hypothetical protein
LIYIQSKLDGLGGLDKKRSRRESRHCRDNFNRSRLGKGKRKIGSSWFEVKWGSLGVKAGKVQTMYVHLDEQKGIIINSVSIFHI